jgi:hypothetical protein
VVCRGGEEGEVWAVKEGVGGTSELSLVALDMESSQHSEIDVVGRGELVYLPIWRSRRGVCPLSRKRLPPIHLCSCVHQGVPRMSLPVPVGDCLRDYLSEVQVGMGYPALSSREYGYRLTSSA